VDSDVFNPRRTPRVPSRCPVEVRERFATWRAETEDVGPRGCQLVTPRLLPIGREILVAIDCRYIHRIVRASARVAWTRPAAPSRLGLAFTGGLDRSWFDDLVASDPAAAGAARRVPDHLPRMARLWLGEPPAHVFDFSAEERAVLLGIGPGTTVGALARGLGAGFDQHRGALFSLLARKLVLLTPGPVGVSAAWRLTLGGIERPPAPLVAGLDPELRPEPVQRLYEEGLRHLDAGRFAMAVTRFRDALRHAPADAAIAGMVKRLAPWA
jgi:hypothetical protein